MQAFHILYRNTQGTLMRILNAASRRGIDLPFVQAAANGHLHSVTLMLDISPKQIGQLCRDWHAIVDVADVRAGAPAGVGVGDWAAPHPPASVSIPGNAARSAMA